MSQSDTASRPRLLRIPDVEQALSLSRATLYAMMDRGELAFVKLGRSRRVPADEVDRVIRDNTVGATAAPKS